jgi:hypothetical protein
MEGPAVARATPRIDVRVERVAGLGCEPAYREVANLIVGDKAPQWLLTFLRLWAPYVSSARAADQLLPTKATMKELMESTRSAASVIQSFLANDIARAFFELHAGPIENRAALERQLRKLEEGTKHAAEGPELSDEKGKAKPGRGRAPCPGFLAPKLYCAVLIAEASKRVHGTYPAPRNEQAARAAQALWRTATGGDDTLITAWRPYFARIGDPALAAIRAEMRRHLVLTEQWG